MMFCEDVIAAGWNARTLAWRKLNAVYDSVKIRESIPNLLGIRGDDQIRVSDKTLLWSPETFRYILR